MSIDWAALGSTFGVSVLITLVVAGAFCLGIAALSQRETAVADGAGGSLRGATALAGVVLSFAACAAAVGYGLYLIAG